MILTIISIVNAGPWKLTVSTSQYPPPEAPEPHDIPNVIEVGHIAQVVYEGCGIVYSSVQLPPWHSGSSCFAMQEAYHHLAQFNEREYW